MEYIRKLYCGLFVSILIAIGTSSLALANDGTYAEDLDGDVSLVEYRDIDTTGSNAIVNNFYISHDGQSAFFDIDIRRDIAASKNFGIQFVCVDGNEEYVGIHEKGEPAMASGQVITEHGLYGNNYRPGTNLVKSQNYVCQGSVIDSVEIIYGDSVIQRIYKSLVNKQIIPLNGSIYKLSKGDYTGPVEAGYTEYPTVESLLSSVSTVCIGGVFNLRGECVVNYDVPDIYINEIGKKDDREFVEFYNNSNRDVDLAELMILDNGKLISHSQSKILPSYQYSVIFVDDHSIDLIKGHEYILLAKNNQELSVVPPYVFDLKEDKSWARFDDGWEMTNQPSFQGENLQYVEIEYGMGSGSTSTESSSLKPCSPGYERNPETNRCRKIQTATTTTATKTSTSSSSKTLAPCNPGYERNPETNRCRKIATTSSTLQPCKEGYERNPETNRCRKIKDNTISNAGFAIKEADKKSSSKNIIGWAIVSVVIISALGYAIWEWRDDIRLAVSRIISKRK